jgi:isopentenyl diphosphate isomerase/L-lactate dehydrogenase-like FMN-dependent dehydrogenase/uncharacterized protein GlcG (DUF336 family)
MKLSEALSIEDLRLLARRRLPRTLFETIESGVEDEYGLSRNEEAFRSHTLYPRYLVDVAKIDQQVELLGRRYSSPFGMSPTGFAGVFRRGADSMMARAAMAANIPFVLSGAGIETLEDVSLAAPAHVWCHLYPAKDPGITRDLVKRAVDAGREVLVVTVDNPVYPNRERDTRNKFGKTIGQQKWATILEAAMHLSWTIEFLRRGGFPRMENWSRYARPGASGAEIAAFFRSQSPSIVSWQDLDSLRAMWPGKLILKGLQHPGDARRAVQAGVDGIVVSNHGGKAHDPLPAPLHTLPGICQAVGGLVPVMIDSGIRRGSDIVVAACLGADFAFVGRATLYGVAAGGQQGVATAIAILRREIDISLALIGCPSFADLGPRFLFDADLAIRQIAGCSIPAAPTGGIRLKKEPDMAHDNSPLLTTRKSLTLAACKVAIDAALAEATKRELKMTVAILDAGGHLLHLSRMDDIHAGTVEVAIAKARSAVMFKRPTKAFAEAYAGGATGLPALPGVLPFEGGVPIIIDGQILGAVGASGASPDLDGVVASAGVEAIMSTEY